MVIEVTGNKYNVGCGRGYGVDIPNLTLKLNLIVDRDRSTWPTPVDKRTQEEKDAGVPGPSPKTEIDLSSPQLPVSNNSGIEVCKSELAQ